MSDTKKTDDLPVGYYCIGCKKNGVFEDSNGYCTLCGYDNLDVFGSRDVVPSKK